MQICLVAFLLHWTLLARRVRACFTNSLGHDARNVGGPPITLHLLSARHPDPSSLESVEVLFLLLHHSPVFPNGALCARVSDIPQILFYPG